ncbi:hypothetical protein [Patulibacter minatonensis]|uniref:hypothetical protein n=1 Tax=Patulibacter minatonensis TaxID=298163 RepID=UPI00047BF717|nr:hypothetical protein [Patulibacter minatonensis]
MPTRTISSSPAARRAAAKGRPFDLGVVAREWDRVSVLPDYSARASAEEDTGASWPDGEGVFGQRDAIHVPAFVRGRKVVSSATVGNQVACLVQEGRRAPGYPRSTRFAARVRDGVSVISVRGRRGRGC